MLWQYRLELQNGLLRSRSYVNIWASIEKRWHAHFEIVFKRHSDMIWYITCIGSWSASNIRPNTHWASARWSLSGTLRWYGCSGTSGRPCPAGVRARKGVTSHCCPGTPCHELSPDERLIIIVRKTLMRFHALLIQQFQNVNCQAINAANKGC